MATRATTHRAKRRLPVTQALLLQILDAQLADLDGEGARTVVDLGGGTGGVATALAERGHRVTVIDPSPDALASLERRTAELGLADRINGLQGDAGTLADLVSPGTVDLVLCHRVLDVVDNPGDALAEVTRVLRPGGRLSLLVPQRHALVLSHALAGHIALAREVLADRSRFDRASTLELVRRAGLEVVAEHGLGAAADYVAEAVVESAAGAYAELLALETELSTDPAFQPIAPALHVSARRAD
ncbi:methyltransferase domain-containing protein [Microlunatus sp. GCM10028923]|uniref:methyltransferase domain-containing protein n=1 Tax=Microlunatus sp. GCM10028923 TaxID=3273400 RepID=UPI003618D1D7